MGSGASAVLVRRQLAAHATTSSAQPDTPVTDTGRKRPRTAVEKGAPSADDVGQSVVVATPGPAQGGGDGEGADTRDSTNSASALDESEGDMEEAHSAAHAGTLGQGGVRRRAVDRLLAAFLAGLPVSLTTPRERLWDCPSAFRFFSLQRSRSRLKKRGRPYACTPPIPKFPPPHAFTTPSPHGPFIASPALLDAKVADWSDRTKAESAFVRSYQPSTCCQKCMPFWHDTSRASHLARQALAGKLKKLRGRPRWKKGD